MERLTRNDIQQKKIIKLQRETKKKKEQQQLVKMVYFPNPVMVTTNAAGFRAIVQKLTGRDSQIADILTRQPPAASAAYVGRSSHHQLATAGSGIFDLPPPVADFPVAGNPFEVLLYDGFGSVEDFDAGVLLDQPLLFETPHVGGRLWGRF